ncbi:protein kinase, partial [bacterium]|nr:protein kinase [bacterium]
MRKFLPDVNFFLGKKVPGQPDYEIVEHIGSGNNAHVFRAHSKKVNNDLACKIIPKENLRGDISKQSWRAEIDSANILDSRIVVRFWHVADWIEPNDNIDCTVLCSDFVDGKTLDEHNKKHKSDISVSFVEEFLREMFTFIDDMERHNVKHGDLHSKNILVEDRSNQLGGPRYSFRVTDFGVTTVTSDASFKDDYDQLAKVLKELLENVDYSAEGPRGKYAFNLLNDHFLARHLCERDTTRDPLARQTRRLYERLGEIGNEFAKLRRKATKVKLVTPFDFLSCEQIGESHS